MWNSDFTCQIQKIIRGVKSITLEPDLNLPMYDNTPILGWLVDFKTHVEFLGDSSFLNFTAEIWDPGVQDN